MSLVSLNPIEVICKIRHWWRSRLSKQDEEFLIEMLRNNCQLLLMGPTNQTEKWVAIGRKDYDEPGDEQLRIATLERLDRLVDLGYIRHCRGSIYELTGKGIERAKRADKEV